MKDLTRIIEALLFTADGPFKVDQMLTVIPEADREAIEVSMEELKAFYDESGRGFYLTAIAGGYQVLSRPELAPQVERFLIGRRRQRLSRAALEVLAVVAYRQPVTRGDVEAVRGVDCGGVLRTLLERRLVKIKGRAKTVGHPLLYTTSDHFLEHFGIASLSDLPKLSEFEARVDPAQARRELVQAGVIPIEEALRAIHGGNTSETEAEDEEPEEVAETEVGEPIPAPVLICAPADDEMGDEVTG